MTAALPREAYNASDAPVVVAADGTTIPGHEHGLVADPSCDEAKIAVARGVLVLGDVIHDDEDEGSGAPDPVPPKTTPAKAKETS